jgi:hypothetical protein
MRYYRPDFVLASLGKLSRKVSEDLFDEDFLGANLDEPSV